MRVVYRPTADELAAASLEQLRLRGLLAKVRSIGALLVVAGLLGLVLGQWLFTLYAVAIGVTVLAVATRGSLRRATRKAPMLGFDTSMEASEDGVLVTIPTAASRVDWAYYAGWSAIPEGLVLMHALNQRLFSFVPRSALTPELLELVTRHVAQHPRARVRAGRP